MMDVIFTIFEFLFFILLGWIFYYFVFYNKPLDDEWQLLPDLHEYLSKYPNCKTEDTENASCCHCGSKTVVFQPLTSMIDPRYKHRCLSCKRLLFKSKSII